MEKTITKCLCKVLEGLSLNKALELPDAVQIIERKAEERRQSKSDKREVNEFSEMLEELVKEAKTDDLEEEMSDEEGKADENQQSDGEEEEEDVANIIKADEKMIEESRQQTDDKKE